ncbi:K02A2.6-like [Cordylochernes scorpioides]|uniref:K02A2.6-like n=1 Tax=Cordylochernes scorpioides TaxID=51811 RepID=A0ABY6LY44_9ARAC|nr:K02A2.6-like [Cordylochernes scorpioides]
MDSSKQRLAAVETGHELQFSSKKITIQFDVVAQANGWNVRDKSSFLAAALRGLAVEVLQIIPEQLRLDFNSLIDALDSRYEEKHYQKLHVVKFKSRLQDKKEKADNLKLSPKKCKLFKKEVAYLGHIISAEGVQTDPEKTETLRKSDHASLQWLSKFENLEGQLARWIHKLQEYQVKIQHRPGKRHQNADVLSRRPCVPQCGHCIRAEDKYGVRQVTVKESDEVEKQHWTGQALRKAQREDRDLLPMINRKESDERQSWKDVACTVQKSKVSGPSGLL